MACSLRRPRWIYFTTAMFPEPQLKTSWLGLVSALSYSNPFAVTFMRRKQLLVCCTDGSVECADQRPPAVQSSWAPAFCSTQSTLRLEPHSLTDCAHNN